MQEEVNTGDKGGQGDQKKRATAGERLAAAQAARAAKKIQRKGTEAEALEREANRRAEASVEWVQAHQGKILLGFGVAAAIAVGGWLYGMQVDKTAGGASQALWTLVQASGGEVQSDDAEQEAKVEDDIPKELDTFKNEEAQKNAVKERYQKLRTEHGGTDAEAWGKLIFARVALDAGRLDEAKKTYDTLSQTKNPAMVRGQAFAGLAFAQEASGALDDARKTLDKLEALGGVNVYTAKFHRARMTHEAGETEKSKQALQAFIESLSEDGAPELGDLKTHAERMLATIDPTLIKRNDIGDLQEQIRIIQQQMGGQFP